MGAFTPDRDRFHPMTPTRWIDTRGGAVQLGEITGVRAATSQTQAAIRGQGGVPQDATAVWLNLTVADPTLPTVLTAYPGPCGTAPLSSNVNARAQALDRLVGDGRHRRRWLCLRADLHRQSHIVVDVGGWFGPGDGGLAYRPAAPTRLLDTRLNGGQPTSRRDRRFTSTAVSVLNVVAVDSTALGFVTVRPCGSPLVSSLINTSPAENTANLTAVGGDAGGNVCVRVEHQVTSRRRPGRHIRTVTMRPLLQPA